MNKKEYEQEAHLLNNNYIYFNKCGIECCKDEEIYHIEWDNLISKILRENGFEKLSEMYEKASKHFWYS